MTPHVIGTRDDVAGFALAGVRGSICTTRAEIERALTTDALFLISADAAAVVKEKLEAWQRSGRGPLFVVLP